MTTITKWIRIYYNKITGSIAFYPALIAIGFLLLSWGMLAFDFSTWGKGLKSGTSLFTLKDASTARSIISTVAGAIISLTVFSFSMVMIVLNQAASQMSNRVLSSMIGNRFQQTVLGFYIGTIVYALFLLSTIRDIDSGVYIPALSIYVLIILTVIDIFLFIYFLDYVTQTVKYETVIDRVKDHTLKTIEDDFQEDQIENAPWSLLPHVNLKVKNADYFQGFGEKSVLKIAALNDLYVSFVHKRGTFLLKGTVFVRVHKKENISDHVLQEISSAIDFYSGQPINRNADYGFNQLSEIAIKALSPGINDPGTAVIALNSLFDMMTNTLYSKVPQLLYDDENVARIFIPTSSFETVFEKCIIPIWNYGKGDIYIQNQLTHLLEQLDDADFKNKYSDFFKKLKIELEQEKNSRLKLR